MQKKAIDLHSSMEQVAGTDKHGKTMIQKNLKEIIEIFQLPIF